MSSSMNIKSGLLTLCLLIATGFAFGQDRNEFGGKSGISGMVSYAPTSQHIWVGHSQDRKTTQAGLGYFRSLKTWSNVRIVYEGSIQPFYSESDPAFLGTSTPHITGPPTLTYFSQPYRPIGLYGDFGYVYLGNNLSAPITGIPAPRESTYAFAALPIGGRIVGFTKFRVQPTIAANLGFLYATRNIPVDSSSSFNFLAYVGPGVEVYWDKRHSARLEYLYEHLSNGGLGSQNPGVDSATFRLTFTHYR